MTKYFRITFLVFICVVSIAIKNITITSTDSSIPKGSASLYETPKQIPLAGLNDFLLSVCDSFGDDYDELLKEKMSSINLPYTAGFNLYGDNIISISLKNIPLLAYADPSLGLLQTFRV